ncbi:hypothetical protein MTO96_042424 [Rhipicephalus appendiculatus]
MYIASSRTRRNDFNAEFNENIKGALVAIAQAAFEGTVDPHCFRGMPAVLSKEICIREAVFKDSSLQCHRNFALIGTCLGFEKPEGHQTFVIYGHSELEPFFLPQIPPALNEILSCAVQSRFCLMIFSPDMLVAYICIFDYMPLQRIKS